MCRGNREALRAACRRETINLILKPVKACCIRPGLLHELELPLDIGVQAHEEQAGLVEVALRIVAPAHPQDAMTIADGKLLRRISRPEGVPRIGSADMRSERAAQPVRIVLREQEIVVGAGRRVALGTGFVWIAHQGRAIALAAHKFCHDPFLAIPSILGHARIPLQIVSRSAHEFSECFCVLLKLPHDQERSASPEIALGGRLRT